MRTTIKWVLCKEQEIVEYFVCDCKKIVQTEFLKDIIKWLFDSLESFKKHRLLATRKCQNHKNEKIVENKKTLWSLQIQTDKYLARYKLDMTD